MSSFAGSEKITLQPADLNLSYAFEVTVASSSSANDGAIAAGSSVSSVVVTSFKIADENGKALSGGEVEVSDLIQGVPSVVANVITVSLNYPTTNLDGSYKLRFVCSLDPSGTKEIDFNRVIAEDL